MRTRADVGHALGAALSAAIVLLGMPANGGGLQAAEPEVKVDPNLHFEILTPQSSILACEPLVVRLRLTNRGKEPIMLRACLARDDWEDHLTLTATDPNSTTRYNYGGRSYLTHCGPYRDVVLDPQECQEQVFEWSDFTGTSFAAAGQYPIQAHFHTAAGVLTATALVQVAAPTEEDAVVYRELHESELVPYLASNGNYIFWSRLEHPTSVPVRQQLRQAIRICRERGGSNYAPYLLSSLISLAHVEHQRMHNTSSKKLLTKEEAGKVLDFARSCNQKYPHARTTLCLAESMAYHDPQRGLKCDDPAEARRLLARAAALKPDPLVAARIRWTMKRLALPATEDGMLMP